MMHLWPSEASADAPDEQTPESRLDLARARLASGDAPGALIALGALAEGTGEWADEAAYLTGVALQRQGLHGEALPWFERVAAGSGPRAADGTFRAADCLARLGRPEEAIRRVAAIEGRTDPADEARVGLSVAAWRLDADDDDRRARRLAERVLSDTPDDLTWFRARVHEALSSSWLEEARVQDLSEPSRAGRRALERRSIAVDVAEEWVAACARTGETEWILPALYDLGRTYEITGDDLLALRPENDPDLARLVVDRVERVWIKAHHHYEAGYMLALRVRWGLTPEVVQLRDARDAMQRRIDEIPP